MSDSPDQRPLADENKGQERKIIVPDRLWRQTRKAAIDQGVSASELVRAGLRFVLFGVRPDYAPLQPAAQTDSK